MEKKDEKLLKDIDEINVNINSIESHTTNLDYRLNEIVELLKELNEKQSK